MKTSAKNIALIVLAVIAAIPVIWAAFLVLAVAFGNLKNWGHQDFARNGVSQIQPAAEMDGLFKNCRHYITYSGRDSVPTWNAVAYFGNRYQLTMKVPVKIKSSSSGSMIGEPRFFLNEVSSVSGSVGNGLQTSFSRGLEFDSVQWQNIYQSGGDFETIGFTLIDTPVPNFEEFADGARPSN